MISRAHPPRLTRALYVAGTALAGVALWAVITTAALAAYVYVGLGCTGGLACLGG